MIHPKLPLQPRRTRSRGTDAFSSVWLTFHLCTHQIHMPTTHRPIPRLTSTREKLLWTQKTVLAMPPTEFWVLVAYLSWDPYSQTLSASPVLPTPRGGIP